ncbi:2Fe-2S iron-sulfur cluster-binding protein [Pantoea vagans]|uniref:2Fe-2S iron-sulfur cluster-binding protein n=2 Tax=Pantoea vagans TaxID=470934 RepID=UPI00225855F1|nr:2Fe-2S iron-sulfur cluster-binding protein [Pantoea vagans]MCX3311643.1 2Fe-2S iron-sulfur cluster-binding protein [Pantoea vagans]
MKLVCEDLSLLTAKMKLFRLRPASNADLLNEHVSPGEYFSFNFKDENDTSFQRCYTLVSAERGKSYEFIIEDKGVGSASAIISKLLAEKKEIEINGRGGEITFNAIREKSNVLLVAGGIGITLPLALIRECFKYYGYSAPDKSVLLMLSCPDLGSVPCLNELLDLHMRCDWFSMRINVTRANLEKDSDIIRQGRADLATADINDNPEVAIVCGSLGFAEAVVSSVRVRFPQATVAVEAFSSGQAAAMNSAAEMKVHESRITIRKLNREIAADNGRTILDNLLHHNVSVRNMCRSGICGSCKFRLDSGSIRSEPDFCLSAKDKAENIHLACCSFPDKDAVIDII